MTDDIKINLLLADIDKVRERLPVWVIYDHPPNAFVARLWFSIPEPLVTNTWLTCIEIQPLQTIIEKLGFTKVGRIEGDDPCILETWI